MYFPDGWGGGGITGWDYFLLVYCPLPLLPNKLPAGAGAPSLLCARLLVLGDFNIHAEALRDKPAQDFLAAIATLGQSQIISGFTQHIGHTLDFVFSSG